MARPVPQCRPSTHALLILPLRVVAIILGYLPHLSALFSAVQANQHFINAYEECAQQIILAILQRECDEVKEHDGFHMFVELDFAIRHDFIHSEHALKALLQVGRPLFQHLQLKELLVPFAERLARKLGRDHLQALAAALLQEVGPRDKFLLRRSMTFRTLLAEWTDQEEDEEPIMAGLRWRFDIARAPSTISAEARLKLLRYEMEPNCFMHSLTWTSPRLELRSKL